MEGTRRTTLEMRKYKVQAGAARWLEDAMKIFTEHGFCVVSDVSSTNACEKVLSACQTAELNDFSGVSLIL